MLFKLIISSDKSKSSLQNSLVNNKKANHPILKDQMTFL